MERITQILVIILILFSTIGVTVTRHYCGGNLESITINHEPNCCGGDEMPDGCCHNEAERMALKDDVQLEVFDYKANLPIVNAFVYFFEDYINNLRCDNEISKTKFAFRSHPPAEYDIYVKIQSFLI